MKEIEFNLLDEPWIRVLRPDYAVEEVSLTDALLRAGEFRFLAGEMPTQDAAVLRLLLAVLHTVVSRDRETGEPAFRCADDALLCWQQIWNQGRFDGGQIRDYLERWRDRFWLFHPERPFYQVPEAGIGTEYMAAKLNGEVSESGTKFRLFSSYLGGEKETMSYAQAARWLVYLNAFDDTSAKPKGKNLPSPGPGWLGKLGLILARGDNLFETLMLNLTLLKDGAVLWGAPKPCWERERPAAGERIEIPVPDNPAQLLTLQSRRLLLLREEERVTGYRLLGGDFFEPGNAFAEQMTVWKKENGKRDEPDVFRPARHDPAKKFWREFPAAFAAGAGVHRPGVVSWLSCLEQTGILDRQMICFQTVAAVYGDKNFFVADTFDDALSFHLSLLGELGAYWQNAVTLEVGRCEQLAGALGRFAKKLAQACGGDADEKNSGARKEFYFQIDQPFREWLYGIDPDRKAEEQTERVLAWRKQAARLARTIAQQMMEDAGPSAFAGRVLKTEKGKKTYTEYVSAPAAYHWFLGEIRKICGGEG